jgi:hypothetical protein
MYSKPKNCSALLSTPTEQHRGDFDRFNRSTKANYVTENSAEEACFRCGKRDEQKEQNPQNAPVAGLEPTK